MALPEHCTNPLLAGLYGTMCPNAADTAFHLWLAAELEPHNIVDLACGTGLLTAELARTGVPVVGVDPAAAMLDVARRRPRGDTVRWVEGVATVLPEDSADLVVMTGHVAQVFVSDERWEESLDAIATAVRPGGHLAFETRNPGARGFEAVPKSIGSPSRSDGRRPPRSPAPPGPGKVTVHVPQRANRRSLRCSL